MAIEGLVKEPSLATVLQISGHARDQATTLVNLMAQSLEQDPVSPELQAEISKAQKLLFTTVSHLRGLHRTAYFAARQTKAETTEARHEVDRLHLQLQNLYYEQRHLEGEISACESYE
jgi:THO complex subunit 5